MGSFAGGDVDLGYCGGGDEAVVTDQGLGCALHSAHAVCGQGDVRSACVCQFGCQGLSEGDLCDGRSGTILSRRGGRGTRGGPGCACQEQQWHTGTTSSLRPFCQTG